MSITDTLDAVEQRINAFPPAIHTEDPRTLVSRILALRGGGLRGYEEAVTRAALSVLLAAAIDHAENLDVTSGSEAA